LGELRSARGCFFDDDEDDGGGLEIPERVVPLRFVTLRE
jgi:hypothetical protein